MSERRYITVGTTSTAFDPATAMVGIARYEDVRVTNIDAAGTVYFTLDGTAPTVGGDDTYLVPKLIGAMTPVIVDHHALGTNVPVLHLIADVATKVMIEVVH